MKKRHGLYAITVTANITACALLLAGCGKSDQSGSAQTSTNQTRNSSGPSFYMPSPIVEFGEVADFETKTAKVQFTNTGTGVLEIIQVKPTCGCTSTKLDKTRFESGEGDTINLTFKPKGSGSQTKTVIVVTNDPQKPNHEIKIKANIIPTLQVTPRSLSFGKVELGSGAKRTLMLKSGNPGYTMDGISAYGDIKDHVTYQLEEISTPGTGVRKWKMDVELKPGMQWGWYTGSLRINGKVADQAGGTPVPSTVTVGMNANLQGNLLASDSMFRLLVLPQNQQFAKTVRISSADNVPFEVLEATALNSKPGGMSVLVELIPESKGTAYDLTLMGNTGNATGAISGNVLLQTSIEGEENVTLKIAGSIRK